MVAAAIELTYGGTFQSHHSCRRSILIGDQWLSQLYLGVFFGEDDEVKRWKKEQVPKCFPSSFFTVVLKAVYDDTSDSGVNYLVHGRVVLIASTSSHARLFPRVKLLGLLLYHCRATRELGFFQCSCRLQSPALQCSKPPR